MSVESSSVIEEYQDLLEKSQEIFAGLMHVPLFNSSFLDSYFEMAFTHFAKLWKFQSEKRFILEDQETYGLKRWEIGELANRISQLYYHYYLRTGLVDFLEQCYVFGEAILRRDYFRDDTGSAALAVQKLLFLSRFEVVCLLLGRWSEAKELTEIFSALLVEKNAILLDESLEKWQKLGKQLKSFYGVLASIHVSGSTEDHFFMENQMSFAVPSTQTVVAERRKSGKFFIQEVVIASCKEKQNKIGDVDIDSFSFQQLFDVSGMDETNSFRSPRRYIINSPTFSMLFSFTSGCINVSEVPTIGPYPSLTLIPIKELATNGILLLYISADKYQLDEKHKGLLLTKNAQGEGEGAETINAVHGYLQEGLLPEDLFPLLRYPLIVIIESESGVEFKKLPELNPFGQLFVLITAPSSSKGSNSERITSILTKFLFSPLHAILNVAGFQPTDMVDSRLSKCASLLTRCLSSFVVELEERANALHPSLAMLIGEPFFGGILAKTVLCYTTLKLCKSWGGELPEIHPQLPPPLMESAVLETVISTIAEELKLTSFDIPIAAPASI